MRSVNRANPQAVRNYLKKFAIMLKDNTQKQTVLAEQMRKPNVDLTELSKQLTELSSEMDNNKRYAESVFRHYPEFNYDELSECEFDRNWILDDVEDKQNFVKNTISRIKTSHRID